MKRQAHDSVDFLTIADVTGKREGAVGVTDASAGSLSASGVAGKQDDPRSLFDEELGDRLAYAHGGAGNYGHFVLKFHAWLVCCGNIASQAVSYNLGLFSAYFCAPEAP